MYRSYKSGSSCCPTPIQNSETSGIPESMRLQQKVCSQATVTINTNMPYPQPDTFVPFQPDPPPSDAPNKILVPTSIGVPIPLVTVGTKSASRSQQERAYNIIFRQTNPYNPDTRFNQYFPPPPIPYVCPERLPSNDPLPSTAPCLPLQRFQGSVKK